MQHEVSLLQTEGKQAQSLIADYKLAQAKSDSLVESLRKDAQAAQAELRQAQTNSKDGALGENA